MQYEGQTASQSINQSAGHSTLSNKTTSITFYHHNIEHKLNKPFFSQGHLVWLWIWLVIDNKYQNDTIISKFRQEDELNRDG